MPAAPVQIARMKILFRLFAPFALVIGFVMALAPATFWGLLGIDHGTDTVIATLYGCVLIGVGSVALAAARAPLRHASLLLFVASYKGFAAIFLCWHGWQALNNAAPFPLAGWVIAALYLCLALICAALYPWRGDGENG